jgi:hypothetical protein
MLLSGYASACFMADLAALGQLLTIMNVIFFIVT